jgi:hypothetical protein
MKKLELQPEFYAAGHILDHLPHNILAFYQGFKGKALPVLHTTAFVQLQKH